MARITFIILVAAAMISSVFAAPVVTSSNHREDVGRHYRSFIRKDDSVDLSRRHPDGAHLETRESSSGKSIPKEKNRNFVREEHVNSVEHHLKHNKLDARDIPKEKKRKFVREERVDTGGRDLKYKKLGARKPTSLNRRAPTAVQMRNAAATHVGNRKRSAETSTLDARDKINPADLLLKATVKVGGHIIREDGMETLAERAQSANSPPIARSITLGPLSKAINVGKLFIRDDETGSTYVMRQTTAIDDFDLGIYRSGPEPI